jgi:type VI protein secretion system component VasF
MDHQQKHQQHHQEQRKHEKQEHKKHVQAQEKLRRTIHPTWFAIIGVILVFAVVMLWTRL